MGSCPARTLFKAIMKGVLRIFSRLMDSIVCCSSPCIRSTTRMAMSQRLDPLDLRLVKDSCPARQQGAVRLACNACQYTSTWTWGIGEEQHARANAGPSPAPQIVVKGALYAKSVIPAGAHAAHPLPFSLR